MFIPQVNEYSPAREGVNETVTQRPNGNSRRMPRSGNRTSVAQVPSVVLRNLMCAGTLRRRVMLAGVYPILVISTDTVCDLGRNDLDCPAAEETARIITIRAAMLNG